MIVMITGDLGTGKTALLTRYTLKSCLHKKVLSNYHLYNIDYEKFDMVDLYVNKPDLKDIIISGDELYTFMDCRSSMSVRNRLESYFITQTRKKNCDLYFTTQFSEFVDLRLISFANIWVKMENIWLVSKTTGLKYKHPYKFIAKFHDYRDKDNIQKKTFIFDGRVWFNEYNTNEVIYPPDDIMQTQKELRKANKKKGSNKK